jgi:hypothetical protein
VIAVLVGGGLVVAGGGLGGGDGTDATGPAGPGTGTPSGVSTEAPSIEPTAAPTATTAPTAIPSPEPTTAVATPTPAPAVGIRIRSVKASSQLSTRPAKALIDGSPATTWKSGADKYEGSWIEVTFAPAAVTRVQIWGGWQVDEPFYYGNHRPRNVTVAFDGGDPVPLLLQDVLMAQRVDIPPEMGITRATRLRITIIDTYPARKTSAPGSPVDAVAVSELRVFGVPVSP